MAAVGSVAGKGGEHCRRLYGSGWGLAEGSEGEMVGCSMLSGMSRAGEKRMGLAVEGRRACAEGSSRC